MSLAVSVSLPSPSSFLPHLEDCDNKHWFAVYTCVNQEKRVAERFQDREIECFLPTYETLRVWKNRQRVKVVSPLFPTYLFVCIESRDRTRVLQAPGVLHIVSNNRQPLPLPDPEIEFLRRSASSANSNWILATRVFLPDPRRYSGRNPGDAPLFHFHRKIGLAEENKKPDHANPPGTWCTHPAAAID